MELLGLQIIPNSSEVFSRPTESLARFSMSTVISHLYNRQSCRTSPRIVHPNSLFSGSQLDLHFLKSSWDNLHCRFTILALNVVTLTFQSFPRRFTRVCTSHVLYLDPYPFRSSVISPAPHRRTKVSLVIISPIFSRSIP